jgi:hypothetical protein
MPAFQPQVGVVAADVRKDLAQIVSGIPPAVYWTGARPVGYRRTSRRVEAAADGLVILVVAGAFGLVLLVQCAGRYPAAAIVVLLVLLAMRRVVMWRHKARRDACRRRSAELTRSIAPTAWMTGAQVRALARRVDAPHRLHQGRGLRRHGDLGADVVAVGPARHRVVVQCKCFRADHAVGSPDVQKFAGTRSGAAPGRYSDHRDHRTLQRSGDHHGREAGNRVDRPYRPGRVGRRRHSPCRPCRLQVAPRRCRHRWWATAVWRAVQAAGRAWMPAGGDTGRSPYHNGVPGGASMSCPRSLVRMWQPATSSSMTLSGAGAAARSGRSCCTDWRPTRRDRHRFG